MNLVFLRLCSASGNKNPGGSDFLLGTLNGGSQHLSQPLQKQQGRTRLGSGLPSKQLHPWPRKPSVLLFVPVSLLFYFFLSFIFKILMLGQGVCGTSV